MTGDVAGEISPVAIPARIALRLWFEAGALAVIGHHPIGFEFEEILGIQILRSFQRTTGNTDGRQRYRPCYVRNRVLDGLSIRCAGHNDAREHSAQLYFHATDLRG